MASAPCVGAHQNLLLCGGADNGRTHMVVACGAAVRELGLRVVFTTVSGLSRRMADAECDGWPGRLPWYWASSAACLSTATATGCSSESYQAPREEEPDRDHRPGILEARTRDRR